MSCDSLDAKLHHITMLKYIQLEPSALNMYGSQFLKKMLTSLIPENYCGFEMIQSGDFIQAGGWHVLLGLCGLSSVFKDSFDEERGVDLGYRPGSPGFLFMGVLYLGTPAVMSILA